MQAERRYRTMVSDSGLWEGFPFREGDVIVSPPPKCGTTWMQMLCALLVLDTADFDRPLTEISPWVDAVTYDWDYTKSLLEAQEHRRVMKTHTPLDGLPQVDGVTYISVGRDPRDVCLSFDNAFMNISDRAMGDAFAAGGVNPTELEPPPEDPRERFRIWVDSELSNGPNDFGVTLANLVNHLQTYWNRRDQPNVGLFHYRDLLADLPGQMRQLAALLEIEIGDERIAELASAATFDSMRQRADELAPGVDKPLWRDNKAFFRSGSNGQWQGLLDEADIRRYEQRLAELAPPDLASWLHTGSLDSTAR